MQYIIKFENHTTVNMHANAAENLDFRIIHASSQLFHFCSINRLANFSIYFFLFVHLRKNEAL